MGELRLEVVDANVVLDSLQLRRKSKLGLYQQRQFPLILALELVDLVEVLLHDDDVGLDDVLYNRHVSVVLVIVVVVVVLFIIVILVVLILALVLVLLLRVLVCGFGVLRGCSCWGCRGKSVPCPAIMSHLRLTSSSK